MNVKLIECPRDAMQGISTFIETKKKIDYINQLLLVGFDTIDFGSFVSPQAIPQLRDTAEVLAGLDLSLGKSKLLAIIGNRRGAVDACQYSEISYLGYPFSVSETFQLRNTNATISESLDRVREIQEISAAKNKQLVVYLSMAFGNPYGDPWHPDIVADWSATLAKEGIKIIALSDTIGIADQAGIYSLLSQVIPSLPGVEIGAHLHATPDTVKGKLEAAYNAGCRRFDGALKGFGGCPMAKDELIGNMNTELMVDWFAEKGMALDLSTSELAGALSLAGITFPN